MEGGLGAHGQTIFNSSVADLARSFNIAAPVPQVCLPTKLYSQFLHLYRRSYAMHDGLKAVIEDGEHRLAMEEGQADFRLPAPDYLEEEVAEFGKALKAFQPFAFTPAKKPDHVWLRSSNIDGFLNVFTKTRELILDVAEVLRNSDYLHYHRYLRDVQQVKYAGPVCLQQLFDAEIVLIQTHRAQHGYLDGIRQEAAQRKLYSEVLERYISPDEPQRPRPQPQA